MWKSDNNLYLDLDGVLADFDKAATTILGMWPKEFEEKYGSEVFWAAINSDPYFFLNLEFMPDGLELYNAVKYLEPTILTGIPRNMNAGENQKIVWVKEKFGQQQKVICCQASKKSQYCYHSGDILIDDRPRYKSKWENKKGIFILHQSTQKTILTLKMLSVIKNPEEPKKVRKRRSK